MAIILDALDIVRNKKRLPVEAFFVDTNVIINYEDPFSRTLDDIARARINEDLTEALQGLKGMGYDRFTTPSVALEYYKHIQVSYYQVFTNGKFNIEDFKKRREEDIGFMAGWDLQIKTFKKLFKKKFPIVTTNIQSEQLIDSFKGEEIDFGDHLLSSFVLSLPSAQQCVFSNDSDFYKFPDQLFVLTTNPYIIKQAKFDKKLY
jgi:hypothetical protein